MPSRREHTKTRHGCTACKARKKRCDLSKPTCQACVRTGDVCEYPNQAPAAGQPWQAHEELARPPPSPLPTVDLELMHHYAVATCTTVADTPAHLHIWQLAVPRLAFAHPFLLHGLLSVAALHRRQTVAAPERPALTALARAHQQVALPEYICKLQDITERDCHALFAYSILLGGLCYGFLQEAEADSPREDILEATVVAFDTLMGAVVVAVCARDWLRQGDLAPLMRPIAPFDQCIARLEPDCRTALESLLNVMPGADGSPEALAGGDHATYTTAIRALSVAFPHADGELPAISELVSWPVAVGAPYLALLKRRDPPALVILAYYGAALHLGGRAWYLLGLGARLVRAVSEAIGEVWRPKMTWAERQISTEGWGKADSATGIQRVT